MDRRRSLKAIRWLYRLASWLCQTPSYDFRRNEMAVSGWDKVRAAAMIALLTLGYVDFMTNLDYGRLSITTLVTYIATMAVSAASQMSAVGGAIFWNRDKWRQLLGMFHETELFLKRGFKTAAAAAAGRSDRLFFAELVLAHVYCLAMLVYQVYTTRDALPPQQIVYYNALIYLIFVSALVNYNFAICLKYRYEVANGLLLDEISRNALSLFVIADFRKDRSRRPRRRFSERSGDGVVRMWGLFTTLGEIATRFNEIFGWNMLFLAVNIVVQLLHAFDSIVIFSTEKNKETPRAEIEDDLIAINFLIAVMLLVFGVIVIVSCDVVSAHARKTANICYKILLEMPLDEEGRADLALFADQCSSVDGFSAAGFFDVNVSLLLSLFGVVASNLIIIIQLNQ